jgi:hypothetical protein
VTAPEFAICAAQIPVNKNAARPTGKIRFFNHQADDSDILQIPFELADTLEPFGQLQGMLPVLGA